MLRKLPPGVEWSEFHKNNKPWSEIDDLVVSIGCLGLQKRTEKGLFAFFCCHCSAHLASLRETQNCCFLGQESCNTHRAQGCFECFVEICELMLNSFIQILSAKLALALWYSVWRKTSVLEVCSTHKAAWCLCTVTCNRDLPFSCLWTSCEPKAPSFSVLISSTRRKDNTILLSLGVLCWLVYEWRRSLEVFMWRLAIMAVFCPMSLTRIRDI